MSLLDNFNIGILFMFLSVSVLASSYYVRIIRFLMFLQDKTTKKVIYSTIKYDDMYYNLIIFLFIFNIFFIFFHNIIYLILIKQLIF